MWKRWKRGRPMVMTEPADDCLEPEAQLALFFRIANGENNKQSMA